jgi:hypothetical protein
VLATPPLAAPRSALGPLGGTLQPAPGRVGLPLRAAGRVGGDPPDSKRDPDDRRNGNATDAFAGPEIRSSKDRAGPVGGLKLRGCDGGPQAKCELCADGGVGAGRGTEVGISSFSGAEAAIAARRGAYIFITGAISEWAREASDAMDAIEERRGSVGMELRLFRLSAKGAGRVDMRVSSLASREAGPSDECEGVSAARAR